MVNTVGFLAAMGVSCAFAQETLPQTPTPQTPGPEVPSPEDPPIGPPGFTESSAPPPPPFLLTASGGGGWDSNALFQPGGVESATAFGEAALTRTWRTPSWTTIAGARGGGSLYQEPGVGSRYDYGLDLSTTGSLSSRTTLTLRGDGGTEYTDRLTDPTAAGLVLPITRSRRFTGQAGLGHRFGARTRMDVNARYSRIYFDSDLLADGEEGRADASLARALGTKTSLVVDYGFGINRYEGGDESQIHTLSGGFSRLLSRRTTLSLLGGVDRRSVESGEASWTPYGDGSLVYAGERSSVSIRYRRGVAPGYGIGQDRILDLFSLAMSLTLQRWLTLTVEGAHGLNTDPVDSALSYTTDEVNVTLRASVTRTLGIVPQVLYRRRGEAADFAGVESVRVGLTLDYVSSLR